MTLYNIMDVLEGTNLRISINLLNGDDEFHLWGGDWRKFPYDWFGEYGELEVTGISIIPTISEKYESKYHKTAELEVTMVIFLDTPIGLFKKAKRGEK